MHDGHVPGQPILRLAAVLLIREPLAVTATSPSMAEQATEFRVAAWLPNGFHPTPDYSLKAPSLPFLTPTLSIGCSTLARLGASRAWMCAFSLCATHALLALSRNLCAPSSRSQ